jgi:hypothetical protein
MKTIAANQVRYVLRRHFDLRPRAKGNGSGHDIWVDGSGRSCRPVLRHKDIPMAILYSLGLELEAKGICDRKQFIRAVMAR